MMRAKEIRMPRMARLPYPLSRCQRIALMRLRRGEQMLVSRMRRENVDALVSMNLAYETDGENVLQGTTTPHSS